MKRTKTAAADAARVSFFAFPLLLFSVCLPVQGFDDVADRLFDRAGQAQNSGDFEFASELWTKFLTDHKEDPQALKARHYLGVCQMTLKKYGPAINAFSVVVDDKKADSLPQLEESYYYLGWCQFTQGQQGNGNSQLLENAIKTFDRHVRKFEKGKFLDQAHFLRAESLYFLGRKKDSIAAYATVVNDFKKSTSRSNALYAMGVSQFETNKYSEAEKTFDTFLSEFEKHSLADEIKLFRAESILQQGLSVFKANPEAGKKLTERANEELAKLAANEDFSKRDEAVFNQAVCEAQLGNQKKAAQLYVLLAEKFEKSPFAASAKMSAGKLFLRTGDLGDAEKWLKVSAETDKANADEAWHWYCQSLLRQKKFTAAVKAAQAAIQSAKKEDFLVRLKMDLGDAQYAIKEQKTKSVATYVGIADQHAENFLAPQALYNASFACLELKDYSRGLELTKKFLDQFPKDSFVADVKYVRGECLLLDLKYDAAEKVYQDLIENHDQTDVLDTWQVRYGLCLYLQDKYEETIKFLDTIKEKLNTPAQQAEAYFLVGASNFYQGDFKKAIGDLSKATAFGKQLKQIDEGLILLAQSQAQENQYDKALVAINELTNNHAGSSYMSQAKYLRGQYLSNQKKYEQAIQSYDSVLKDDQNKYTPYALYGKGWALLNTQKNRLAKSAFDSLIKDFEAHDLRPDAFYSRAVARRRLKEFKQAVADIDQCLKLKPNFKNLVSALYEKGMSLSSDQQYIQAVSVFEKLTSEFDKHQDADEFLYQLAWAYKLSEKPVRSVASFQKLFTSFPDSVAAAEAHYHFGESLYLKKDYDQAIEQYKLAKAKAMSNEVAEKALYKQAWSHYQKKDFDKARTGFESQVTAYEKGDLSDSARFMVAECLFQQDKFPAAHAMFEKVVPDVLKSGNTNKTEKALACLHAAESANKVRQYQKAVEYVALLTDDLKDKDYVAEAFLELGNARRGLKEPAAAITAFSRAFDLANNETGARAGFLVGEVLFGQKKFTDAIRQYKLVMYGYGGTKAPASIRKWQCSSGYETARCYHVQIKEQNPSSKQKYIDEARKFYTYVIQNHPEDRLAAESKKQLAVLDKLK